MRVSMKLFSVLALTTVSTTAVAQRTTTPVVPANVATTTAASPTSLPLYVPTNRTPETGSFPSRRFAQSKFYQNNYQQVQEYGRCVSHIVANRARDLLSASPNSEDEINARRLLVGTGRPCLSYGYRAPTIFLRGGVSEAMYLQDEHAGVAVDHAPTGGELVAFYTAEAARSGLRTEDDRRFTALANCIVTTAPAAVHAVLKSEHGSPQERLAMDAAFDASPTCGTNRNLSNSGGTTFLRAYLAESAYRWAQVSS